VNGNRPQLRRGFDRHSWDIAATTGPHGHRGAVGL